YQCFSIDGISSQTHNQWRLKMLKRLVLIVGLASTMMLSLSACHTMAGAGEDIQQGGQKLEDSAHEHSD
ncbi:MAG TPA: entericidin A/B family lipoprotein, partial [Methylophilaceae bacterium]|nr:entericidin A/B family lipoprotein [Methylophilaceae bacterium]